jgi:hypothetical protein
MQMVIEKFYPNIRSEAKADLSHHDLNELEAILV